MKKYLTKIIVIALLITLFATPILACSNTPRTIGYWKNISESSWPVNGAFCYDGVIHPWMEILGTPTQQGDGWYILAKQYIAFVLNCNNDALSDDQGLCLSAQNLLNKDPGSLSDTERAEAIALAKILEGFNRSGEL